MVFESNVSRAEITLLVENSVDMLLPNERNIRRVGLYEHFKPDSQAMLSENGVAFLIDVSKGVHHQVILFDTGLSGIALMHNMRNLGRSPDEVTHVVISHGHPDHYGGLLEFLRNRQAPLPIAIHPAAFSARYIYSSDGDVIPMYTHGLVRNEIENLGGRLVLSEGPLLVAPGVTTTGSIPAAVPFEPPVAEPGFGSQLVMLRDGEIVSDATPDDQALTINIADKGLFVLTGCAHAGVVSSVLKAMEVTGVDRLYGVMGGFHLGFPGVSPERAKLTVQRLKEFEPEVICPMHCTGLHALSLFYAEMPDQFARVSTGMRLSI